MDKHKDLATNMFTPIACEGLKRDNKTPTDRSYRIPTECRYHMDIKIM